MKMFLSKCRLFIIFLTFCYILDSGFADDKNEKLKAEGFTGNKKSDMELCETKLATCAKENLINNYKLFLQLYKGTQPFSVFESNYIGSQEKLKAEGFTGNKKSDMELCETKLATCAKENLIEEYQHFLTNNFGSGQFKNFLDIF